MAPNGDHGLRDTPIPPKAAQGPPPPPKPPLIEDHPQYVRRERFGFVQWNPAKWRLSSGAVDRRWWWCVCVCVT